MTARLPITLVAVLSVIAGRLIEVSAPNIPKQGGCLRVCGLDKERSFTKRVQALKFISCYQCLKRRRDQHAFTAKTIVQRRRRSIFTNYCIGRVDDGTPVPEQQKVKPIVIFGQYENTDNWYANVSWPALYDPGGHLTGHLIRLGFFGEPDILCTVLPKNQTSVTINISHYGYHSRDPIYILVKSIPFNNLQGEVMGSYFNTPTPPPPPETTTARAETTPPPPTITTTRTAATTKTTSSTTANASTTAPITNGSTGSNVSSTTIPPSKLPTSSNTTVQYVSIFIGLTVGILVGILAYLLIRKITLRYRCGYHRAPAGFETHVFIMFNMQDSEWMKNNLLHLLEETHHLKCRIHYRDFEVGSVFFESMSDSIYTSYKNIAVYSKNFLNSRYCRYELHQAEQRLLSKNDDSLVIIRIDEADLRKLPEGLRNRSVIDYDSSLERPHWEKKLLKFLNVRDDSSKPRATAHAKQNSEDNKNSNADHTITVSTANNGRIRTHIDRLNSTNSTDTEVSFV